MTDPTKRIRPTNPGRLAAPRQRRRHGQRAAEQLVTEADPEERDALVQHAAQQGHLLVRGGRVPWPFEKNTPSGCSAQATAPTPPSSVATRSCRAETVGLVRRE